MRQLKIVYYMILALLAVGSTAYAQTDALGDDGNFTYYETISSKWSLNITTNTIGQSKAAIGALEGEYDDNNYYVLKFWSNGIADYDYYIQALHPVTLQYGYSYQIKAQGYYFYNSLTGNTNYGATLGIQSPDGEEQYLSEKLIFDEDGFYASKTYKHCDATNSSARLYVNGGGVIGDFEDYPYYINGAGFSLMSISVIKTAINCGSITPTSSASTPKSSASSQLTGNGKGPVSQYGQLQTGTNSSGYGRIYGSCPTWSKSGKEVQVKGMSLFWSINEQSAAFWNADVVTRMVQEHNIQLIRAAMGVDENWGDGNYFTQTTYYQGLMDKVVQAAIDNDIYVIIDYHSHRAHEHPKDAQAFFSRMASKWGGYDNVIFEIFNEPACITGGTGNCNLATFGGGYLSWTDIKSYANDVIATIREYSDNLIIVGTPMWDQQPNVAIGDEVTDPANNTAYAFHYYAGSHSTGTEGANAVKAMNAGLSVFVSEWGTINADGKGAVASTNTAWQNWMNTYKLSSANWSLTNLTEGGDDVYGDGQGGSYFSATTNPSSTIWGYSNSGSWLNENVFDLNLPAYNSYTACEGTTIKSSSSKTIITSSSSATVIPPASSASVIVIIPESSASEVPTSSAAVAAGWWTSENTRLTANTREETLVSDLLVAGEKRTLKHSVTIETAGEYTVSFKAATAVDENEVTIKVYDENGKMMELEFYDISPKGKTVSCKFSSGPQTIQVAAIISNPLGVVTISDFTITGGSDAIRTPSLASFNIAVQDRTLQIQSARGESVKVQVFDMMGNAVLSTKLSVNDGSASASLDAIPSGNYIIRVTGKNAIKSFKASLK